MRTHPIQRGSLLAALAAGLLAAGTSRAQVLVRHVGQTDPLTENWIIQETTPGSALATFASGNDGEDYRQIDAPTSYNAKYAVLLTTADVSNPAGWTATMRAKLVNGEIVAASELQVLDGQDVWDIFLSDGSGTGTNRPPMGVYTRYRPGSSNTYKLLSSIDPRTDYHTYQIVYNPAGDNGNGGVTFYMDGTEIGTLARGQAIDNTGTLRMMWGDNSTTGNPSATRYSFAQFEYGQVPAVNTNDACANATAISAGTTLGTTLGATSGGGSSCGNSDGSRDVWYSFTPTSSGVLNLDTCGSSLDTVVAVLDMCGGSELACNDDCSGAPCGGSSACLALPVSAGENYLIRVAGANGDFGSFMLNLSLGAPTNDTCAGALIAAEGAVQGTTAGADMDGAATCADGNNPDVWYSYTPALSGILSLTLCDTTFAAGLSVHSGCPGDTGNQIACSGSCTDGPCASATACLTLPVTAQTTYLIRVFGGVGQRGEFTLNVALASNDTCADALPLTDGSHFVTTLGATNDGTATCGNSSASPDVWFTYTASCNGTMLADLCGAGFGSVLSVYRGTTCPPTTEAACNDDCGGAPCGGAGSCVQAPVLAGETVLIRVSGANGASGNAMLNVSCVADPPPANDDCSAAEVVTPGSVTGKTLNATVDGDADCGTSSTTPDVWYSITAPVTGRIFVSPRACTSYPVALSLHAGCPGNQGNVLGCTDRGMLIADVIANTTYLLRVSGEDGATGTFELRVRIDASPGILTHSGQTDPLAIEDWTTGSGGDPATAGPGQDEEPYWEIQCPATSNFKYRMDLDDYVFADAAGWTATARVKMLAGGSKAAQAQLQIVDGQDIWDIYLANESNPGGRGVWHRGTPSDVLLSDIDPSAMYHTYQIVFDPAADGGDGAAAYYMDGELLGTATRGQVVNNAGRVVLWGDNSTNGDATQSRWSFAQLEFGQRVVMVCNDPLADADGDHDVDMADFGAFQECFTGPITRPLPRVCRCLDLNADAVVDGNDLAAFLQCVSGPAVMANPDCD